MLYEKVKFGNIKFGKLFKAIPEPKFQTIYDKERYLPFDNTLLKDYDYLSSKIIRSDFWDLPYYTRALKPDEVGRPDLISYREYGDTDGYFYILMFNRIADPFEGLKEGMNVKIPFYDSLVNWIVRNLM